MAQGMLKMRGLCLIVLLSYGWRWFGPQSLDVLFSIVGDDAAPVARGERQAVFQLPPFIDVATTRAGFIRFFQDDAARRYKLCGN